MADFHRILPGFFEERQLFDEAFKAINPFTKKMFSNIWKRFGKALASSALAAIFITTAHAAAPAKDAKGNDLVAGEVIIKFKPTATDAEIQHGLKLGHLKVKQHKQTEAMKARGHNG